MVAFSVLIGLAVAVGLAQPPPPAVVFHSGASAGIVRDATKVGSTIYAVGTWNNSGRIDGALWTFDGNDPPVRTALPDIGGSGTNLAAGEAITPDAAYIASQARSCSPPSATCVPNGPTAVRVTRSPLTNLDLTPAPTFTNLNNPKLARAISSDGSVLYGHVKVLVGSSYRQRVVRFDTSSATTAVVYPQPEQISGYLTDQAMLQRGASSDGTIAVGQTFTTAPFIDTQAFRYVHGTGVSLIPRLGGGTWNAPIALTDDGKIVALVGNSTAFPNREVYLYDYNTVPARVTPLGSPNTPWNIGIGGISNDGAVVAVTAQLPCAPNVCRYAYFHNRHGWFHLTTALAFGGVDLSGWEALQVLGMSGDGTLVWGSGLHNGAEEGFVVEMAADYLKDFDVAPAPPADMSIVGAWTDDPSNPSGVAVFMPDGTYYQIEASGFERGVYEWDGSMLRITTRQDTNGSDGFSHENGVALSISVAGSEFRVPGGCVVNPLDPEACFVAARVAPATPTDIVGGWALGDAALDDRSAVAIFTAAGRYFLAQDGPGGDSTGQDGIEIGSYQWNGVQVGASSIAPDTNGEWGLSHPMPPVGDETLTVTADGLAFTFTDGADVVTGRRIAPPVVAVVAAGNDVVVAPTSSLSLTFDTVTAAGSTTVEVIDPVTDPEAPAPPSGFSLGDPPIYYEIETTAGFTGPVTVCFSYAGINFGTSTPRLFHFEDPDWVDISLAFEELYDMPSVNTSTQTICGVTQSFSPFALLVSPVTRTGFYQPVSSTPGFVNVVSRGSTVPLKFNVFIDGIEKTDTAGLVFSVASSGSCAIGADENAVTATSTGATALRYDTGAGHFVQNWKTPRERGCYVVRVTTRADGLSLIALFDVK